MNDDDRAFERAIRELLEDGSDRTPADTIDAVLLAVRTTPQERDLRVPWRTTPMSNVMRLVAAIAIAVVAASVAFNVFRPSGGVGVGASPSPTVTPAPTPSPQSSPTPLTAGWTTYTSNRYGFTIGHPVDWTVRAADHNYTSPTDGMTQATEGFIAPDAAVLVSAWSVVVPVGTSANTWIQTYCPKSTTPCTGIQSRAVPVTMDGHAGVLVPFTSDIQAFFLVGNRMYIVAEWRPEFDQTVLPYGSGRLLVEGFLSTMHLLPDGPAPSASTPRPS